MIVEDTALWVAAEPLVVVHAQMICTTGGQTVFTEYREWEVDWFGNETTLSFEPSDREES